MKLTDGTFFTNRGKTFGVTLCFRHLDPREQQRGRSPTGRMIELVTAADVRLAATCGQTIACESCGKVATP